MGRIIKNNVFENALSWGGGFGVEFDSMCGSRA